jgi:hypothetical protein
MYNYFNTDPEGSLKFKFSTDLTFEFLIFHF